MKKFSMFLTAACLLSFVPQCALAQNGDAQSRDGGAQGAPAEVSYLMPAFGNGMIYFNGQVPAQGKLNICAVDNTLRFIDKSGKELVAANEDNIMKVRIDTVFFLHSGGIYYRMYPVYRDIGIALKRDVQVVKEGKQGAYGTVSQTASIRENDTFYADGVAYDIKKDKPVEYRMTETLFLYKGDDVLMYNKKNLRKLFPERKAEIDEFFKSGGSLPESVSDARALMSRWAE